MSLSNNTPYSAAFYSTYANDSYRSAKVLLPVVKELIQPQRIVDVGCGVGTWLRVWEELGASSIVGVDGTYVSMDALQIKKEQFFSMDLTHPSVVPGAPFDLVQSLEVGEHLPADSAQAFVDFLCSLSSVVLFSAAIPHQGGTAHVNEQWPEYWASLFSRNSYSVFDVVRAKVWHRSEVAYYYAQNSFLFVSQEKLGAYPQLSESLSAQYPLARVHPRKWEDRVNGVPRFEHLIAAVPGSALEFATRLARRVTRARPK